MVGITAVEAVHPARPWNLTLTTPQAALKITGSILGTRRRGKFIHRKARQVKENSPVVPAKEMVQAVLLQPLCEIPGEKV